jgi:hypothetical protein
MRAIIIEGVLFAALIAVGFMLVRLVVRHYTPVGTRLEQSANRVAIERASCTGSTTSARWSGSTRGSSCARSVIATRSRGRRRNSDA